jgi:ketosteroid isomerase-like protein
MAQSNVEAIQALYRAFLKRELMTILSLVDSGIEIRLTDQLPWGGTYKGLGGLKDFFGKLLENLDSKVEFTEWIEAGESVVAIGRSHGKVLANGNEFDIAVVHVWHLRDGKAVKFEPYIDTAAMLKALGK